MHTCIWESSKGMCMNLGTQVTVQAVFAMQAGYANIYSVSMYHALQ